MIRNKNLLISNSKKLLIQELNILKTKTQGKRTQKKTLTKSVFLNQHTTNQNEDSQNSFSDVV